MMMNLIYLGKECHIMERYRFLALFLPIMAAAASAQTPFSMQTESAQLMGYIYDYYLPVLAGIFLLFLLFSGLNMILRRIRRRFGLIEFGASVFGVLLALVLIVTGIVFLAAFGALAWGTAIKDMSFAGADGWAVPIAEEIQYLIQPFLDMIFGSISYTLYLQDILLGVLLVGGGIILTMGILLLVKLPKSSFYEIIKPSGTTTFKEVMTRGQEPLAPTVTFKVIDRNTNQASADVKVILKHKEGAKVYTRYTDFNGEVAFQKIDGLYSQYYAYVEGDEERKRYWVIRTAIGAESVT
jgi:hypothetical protein